MVRQAPPAHVRLARWAEVNAVKTDQLEIKSVEISAARPASPDRWRRADSPHHHELG
jgi:hypothetical protein